MNITTKPVEYMDGKTKCVGYLAWDESVASARPCVLIAHAWGGLDEFAKDKAVQIAAQGYVGFVLDNYGDGAQPESLEDKTEMMMALKNDRAKLLKRLKAGMRAAGKLGEVDEKAMAIMGFCFGGLCALDLARSGADLEAAISFHGLLDAPDLPKKKNIKADVLICTGWDDPMAPPQDIVKVGEEFNAISSNFQILAFGHTSHAFMVPGADDKNLGLKYNPVAEKRAWTAAIDLLNDKFAMHGVT